MNDVFGGRTLASVRQVRAVPVTSGSGATLDGTPIALVGATMTSYRSQCNARVCRWIVGWHVMLMVLALNRAAFGFDLTVSGVAVRAPNRVSNEVFALLTLPLDEWFTPTRELARLSRQNQTVSQVWLQAEALEFQARSMSPVVAQAQAEPDPADQTQARPTRPSPKPRTALMPTAWVPRLDTTFVRGLMAACNREFRESRVELSELASRARSSAWLPELQLKGGRNTDETLRLTPTEAEPDRYQLVGGDGVRFEGQIRWTFNQLVFARDELAVARLRGALESEKRRREHHAMDVLGKWLRAWLALGNPGEGAEERVDAWIDERALRAELDWLSQGWFSRHVKPSPDLASLAEPESP